VKIVIISLMLMGLVFSSWAQEKERPREWNQILAEARKEGRVVVTSSPDATFRNQIMPKFMARFGIAVEFLAGRSSEIAARIRTERAAGVYSMDVFLFGPDSTAKVLYAEKVIDPLKPLLVLPEVVDATKWKRGKLWFIDPEEKYVLRVFNRTREFFPINAEYVKAAEIGSAKDLLNPKWRGKIVTEDPTSTGRPAAQAELFYNQMGEEFFKRLYIDQKLVTARERRQAADWLARGIYPICLTCRTEDSDRLRVEGFKILDVFELSDMRPFINSSPWLLTVANKAPHPNAAQVFVNWLASKEGLEVYSRGYSVATLRNDVDESFLDRRIIPRPGINYVDVDDWNYNATEGERIRLRIREILKQDSR
jgi:iron(III) transport system substrate-binding protein